MELVPSAVAGSALAVSSDADVDFDDGALDVQYNAVHVQHNRWPGSGPPRCWQGRTRPKPKGGPSRI